MDVVHPSGHSEHGRGARRALRGMKMGVTAYVWYLLHMFLIVPLDSGWLRFFASFFKQSEEPVTVLEALPVTGRVEENQLHRTKMQTFFSSPFLQHFKNASTHGENLSPSVKTDISNSMFDMDTKLGACQSSHMLGSKAYFSKHLLEEVSYASTRYGRNHVQSALK